MASAKTTFPPSGVFVYMAIYLLPIRPDGMDSDETPDRIDREMTA